MGRRPMPLPEQLGAVFTVSRALEFGVGADRLIRPDLHRPAHGVRTRAAPATLVEQLRSLTAVLPPTTVYSHATAAQLLRLPLLHPVPPGIHVRTPPGSPRIVRAGVIGHRGSGAELVVHGVRCTDPVVTWADLAGMLSVDGLVVLGDAVLARAAFSPDLLHAEIERRGRGARGVRRLRAALELMRVGSASPMETMVRLVLHRAGLPEPLLNLDILDETGWVARLDLCWPDQRVALEFDGDQHRTDRRQWQRDVRSRRHLAEIGWTVIVVTADDLRHPAALIESVTRALGHPTIARGSR